MTAERNMALVLGLLMAIAVVGQSLSHEPESTVLVKGVVWNIFLFGLPLALIGFLVAGQRWALMGGVIYGTIGLALDLATILQDLTKPETQQTVLLSAITGVLSLLLIVIGGRGFLHVVSSPTPPLSRPPSPRSH